MAESADFDESGAIAQSISVTSLVGTGLAKESGGNLDTHTRLLSGTSAGALIGTPGNTVALETAALIASGVTTGAPGGVPLLHGVKNLLNLTGQVIAASGSITVGPIVFAKPGYMIRILAGMSAAGAAIPFVEAQLQWSVSTQPGQLTSVESWYLPASGVGTIRTNGRGPTKGDTLNIVFTNGDAVDTATINVGVWETTQHLTRDDFRSAAGAASASAVNIGADAPGLIIGQTNTSIPATSVTNFNMPLYAGQVNININTNTAAGSTVTLVPVGDITAGATRPLRVMDWTMPNGNYQGIILPRAPCQLQASNAGAAAFNFVCSVVALEYAS